MDLSSIRDIDSAFRGGLRQRLGLLGIVVLSAVAALRFAYGQVDVATVNLVWVLSLAGALLWMRRVRDSTGVGTFMAAISMACSVARIDLLGPEGVAWVFPILLGVFAVTTRTHAAAVAALGIAAVSVLVARDLDVAIAASVSISLALTALVAFVASTHVEHLRMRLTQLASRDALTGAGNRRALGEALLPFLATGVEGDTAVAMLDLDHFKRVNDLHGHAAGDRVLVEFAALVRRVVRPGDRLFRFGGEEFVLLMPATTRAEALAVATRINEAVREGIRVRQAPVTVSIGLAQVNAGESADAVLARADAALYAAKAGGRDRSVAA